MDAGWQLKFYAAFLSCMQQEVWEGIQSKDFERSYAVRNLQYICNSADATRALISYIFHPAAAAAPSVTECPPPFVPLPPARHVPCTGIPLAWDATTFWETYPFQIHSSSAKQPAKYDLLLPEAPNTPRARSKQCEGTFLDAAPAGACAKCSELVLDISIVRDRASRSFEHTLDLTQAVDSAHKRLAEYIDLIQYIGEHTHEIHALHRLLANAVVNGWSANYTLEHCRLSVAGNYTA
ncbi:hypothetical protein B0H10DRAFT_2341714 [Mycena sp. CBHHK59/15]|nr:hypothetical protein B0H10DRAFT_2341714 [Mycena sp. CBHHK59/15]